MKPKLILLNILIINIILTSCTNKPKNEVLKAKFPDGKAILEYKTKSLLGEGAFWNHITNELYWVDIEGKKLHIYDPETKINRTFLMPSRIGTVTPKDKNNAIVALENGIYNMNIETKTLNLLSNIEEDKPYNRFNDGKCDPSGRLWVGSMNFDTQTKSAALYMIDSIGKAVKKLDSVAISNGIVWTSDKKTMYYIDTPLQTIRAFDYDDQTGNISNDRIAVIVNDTLGSPDGMAIDENDELWVGLWNGSAVGHFDPKTGKLIKKIHVPAQNVTSCAFGGKNLDTLYITTASLGTSKDNELAYPNAGSIFKYVPGVKGVKSALFK